MPSHPTHQPGTAGDHAPTPETPTARSTLFNGEMAVVALLALAIIASRAHGYLLFHTLAELFSVVVGLTAFSIAWNTRRSLDSPFLLIAGLSFGPAAVIDLMHTLAYKGLGVFASDDPNLATELWIAGRVIQVGGLVAAAAWPPAAGMPRPGMVLAIAATAAMALLGLILGLDAFPDAWREGEGLTPFKIGAEYVFMAALALALLPLWRHRDQFPPALRPYLSGAIILTIAEEACFTLYTDVYGVLNMAGHVLKIAVFYLIYAGLVRFGFAEPQAILYRQLSRLNARLADDALRSNERASLALAAAGGAAWEWDMGDGDSRLTHRHGQWLDQPGTPTRTAFDACIAPEDQAAAALVAAPRSDETPRAADLRLDLPHRPPRWLHRVTQVRTLGGRPLMLGLDIDITATKLAEQERLHLHESLARSHADLARFTEILAHHLQEPVRMQFAFAQRLRKAVGAAPPPDLGEPLAYIQSGAGRLRALLRDVQLYLALADLPPPTAPTPLGPVVERVRAALAEPLRQAGASLSVTPLPQALMTEARLTDLFRLLIDNAIRFRRRDRPLAIRIEVLAPVALPGQAVFPPPGMVAVAVTDNGVGIAPAYRERVFAVFERLETGWDDESTGIGLALARRIVEGAGGRIWIEDGDDGGVSVRFLLPTTKEKP